MKKKLIALFWLYVLQFLATACNPCDCDVSDFESTYTAIELEIYNTSGFQHTIAETDIPKDAFGIVITLITNDVEITDRFLNLNLGSFGFNAALACDCDPPEYIFTDPIVSLEILVSDAVSNSNIDVTNSFTVTDFNGDVVPIATYFQNRDDATTSFQLD
ncbi:unnamed protein product, partial [Ectocarpus sp. 12 AP-2014]